MSLKYIFAIGWTLLILAGCTIPGNDIPKVGFDLFEFDKVVHFTFFAGYGWFWARALPTDLPGKYAWIGITGILYAVGTEIYQGMLPWERTPDPMDALANLSGLLMAIFFYGLRDKSAS